MVYHDKLYYKTPELDIKNTDIVVIGDSLGRHIANDYGGYAKVKRVCGSRFTTTSFFWQTPDQHFCASHYTGHQLSPFKQQCLNQNVYPYAETTTIAFIPHGKMIHHGGCDSIDMPWMVDTFKRLEKYGIFSDSKKSTEHSKRTIIYLTAGAHFSIFNPVILYRRLEELKSVIYAFLDRHPGTLVIYRLSNFWGGSIESRPLCGTSSSWNARRLNWIIRYVFEADNRVKILDPWKMTEAVFDTMHGIHPEGKVREMAAQELRKFTSKCLVEMEELEESEV